jgi:hypothetical protein
MAVTYRARVGLEWTEKDGAHRAEPGELVPEAVVRRARWLLEQQLVEPVVDGGEGG